MVFILYILVFNLVTVDCFELIEGNNRPVSNYSIQSGNITRWIARINVTKRSDNINVNYSKVIKKRAIVNNFFEDEDQGKSNNVDYIDFNGAYGDEIVSDPNELKQNDKNKRTIDNDRPKRKKRRRKKHRPYRYKRKDDSKHKKPSKPSYSDLKYAVQGLSDPKKFVGLQVEEGFHRLYKHVMKGHDDKKTYSKNGKMLENDDETNENQINKVLDKLIPSDDGGLFNLETNGNEKAFTTKPPTTKPNYLGNFHVIIKIPKDRKLNELQNLTLVTGTDTKQQNLDKTLENLRDSIDKLANQMKTNSDINNESIDWNNNPIKNVKPKKYLKSKKMICTKDKFCYPI